LVVAIAEAIGQYAGYATTYAFVPIYAAALGSTPAQLGWLTSSMQLAYVAATALVALCVSDRTEKWVAAAGLTAISVASVWVISARSIGILILTRVLHGVGHGLSLPVLMGLAVKHVPPEDRASAMGAFQAIYALGMFSGPAFSGLLAQRIGIESVFYSTGAIVITVVPFLIWGLNRNQSSR
jgi:MFS family permease